jgi:UDP-N-acetylglucosamine--N-acetylmuramyl-(pentapeptide) pyrophosphoryl-undecaprenol N-acetylglucosamine transferase
MPDVMAASELIMGRSGAGIWEWAVLGKPMVLIPLRGSGTRGDQIENARYFEKAGAAQVLSPTDDLPAIIGSIAQDDKKRDEMIIASAKIGQQDGAKIITHILKEGIIDLFND